jgi:hypothetical protein
MFMERCMFGRHMKRRRISPGFYCIPSSNLEVLPVTESCYVGKATLVEHVCMDEAVLRNFTHILRFNGEDLHNIPIDNTERNDYHRKYLMIVELVDDTDVVTWGKLYHYLRHRSNGSKVILISRLDQVSSLGITSRGVLVLFQGPRIWECKPI